ncbi:hypothetical protein JN531_013370 [Flagellatimonas centrodinii]|uniref:hypothetical protein n=1 Tax=Flagellatimonas centrodinii TaxID=2806210 RepID=UPI001FF02AFC|nr:hypothetical protein [Flagellatimonas centrodinii]ULQ46085.1 hypothetical protein JN531_013370 [Flagellatimonas centrodinii]
MLTDPLLPLWLKLAYSAFMLVLVPVYWRAYGWTNFLYFCDVALILTWVGLWTEHPLPISIAAVGILVAQAFWLLDFSAHLLGRRLTGMTDYMFDSRQSRFLRGLSLFHGWLPLLLLALVLRMGYDPRALPLWIAIATVLLLVSYRWLPGPPPRDDRRPVNINYVHGLSDEAPQTWMHPHLWLAVTLIGFPVVLYLPAHVLLLGLAGP